MGLWRRQVFTHGKWFLNGPICTCEKRDYAWGVLRDNENRNFLEITCSTCGTKLQIPNKKFLVGFIFKDREDAKKSENQPVTTEFRRPVEVA